MSETNPTMTDLFGEVIHSYTRAQAIEDGVLIDLSAIAPDVCRQHYKYPIACTAPVWSIIDEAVNNPRFDCDHKGIIHDMLFMSIHYKTFVLSEQEVIFECMMPLYEHQKVYQFKMNCGPNDDLTPCLTIMLPNED